MKDFKKQETYFLILALLLALGYQFLSHFLLGLDAISRLSSFSYYALSILIRLVLVLPLFLLLKSRGKWQSMAAFSFRWSYLLYLVLGLLALHVWNLVGSILLAPPANAVSYQQAVPTYTGATIFLVRFLYPVLVAPFCEELVYRGLVQTACEPFSRWGLDVLIQALLFSLLHISSYGWLWTDFLFYLGGGLIFGLFFRRTKSLYWSMGLHMTYNGLMQVLMLLA